MMFWITFNTDDGAERQINVSSKTVNSIKWCELSGVVKNSAMRMAGLSNVISQPLIAIDQQEK